MCRCAGCANDQWFGFITPCKCVRAVRVRRKRSAGSAASRRPRLGSPGSRMTAQPACPLGARRARRLPGSSDRPARPDRGDAAGSSSITRQRESERPHQQCPRRVPNEALRRIRTRPDRRRDPPVADADAVLLPGGPAASDGAGGGGPSSTCLRAGPRPCPARPPKRRGRQPRRATRDGRGGRTGQAFGVHAPLWRHSGTGRADPVLASDEASYITGSGLPVAGGDAWARRH